MILGAGGALAGGIGSAVYAGKARKIIKKQQAENNDLYNRRYNENYTQRADAQAALNRGLEALINRNKAANAMAAVSGASGESVARDKAANAMAYGNMVGDVALAGVARKDAVEQDYQNRRDQYNQEQIAMYDKQADAMSAMGSQMAAAGGAMASGDGSQVQISSLFKG